MRDDDELDVKVEPRAPKFGNMPSWWPVADRAAAWLDRQISPAMWLVIGLVGASFLFGTPHLLVTYHCFGHCTPQRAYACDYLGVTGWKAGVRADPNKGCDYIRIL